MSKSAVYYVPLVRVSVGTDAAKGTVYPCDIFRKSVGRVGYLAGEPATDMHRRDAASLNQGIAPWEEVEDGCIFLATRHCYLDRKSHR